MLSYYYLNLVLSVTLIKTWVPSSKPASWLGSSWLHQTSACTDQWLPCYQSSSWCSDASQHRNKISVPSSPCFSSAQCFYPSIQKILKVENTYLADCESELIPNSILVQGGEIVGCGTLAELIFVSCIILVCVKHCSLESSRLHHVVCVCLLGTP